MILPFIVAFISLMLFLYFIDWGGYYSAGKATSHGSVKIFSESMKNYNDAKRKAPNKPERDYLKMVLINTPPFDWQLERVIEGILDEYLKDINDLSDFLAISYKPDNPLWKYRELNIMDSSIKEHISKNKNDFLKAFF
jgi:hypothetical protein